MNEKQNSWFGNFQGGAKPQQKNIRAKTKGAKASEDGAAFMYFLFFKQRNRF